MSEALAKPLRILVCGNRDLTLDKWGACIRAWLMPFHARWQKVGGVAPLLIHGDCGERDEQGRAYKGADRLAHDIAFDLGWRIQACPADWDRFRDSAGPRRNREMFGYHRPHRGLAFGRLCKPRSQDDTGTGDMVKVLNQGFCLVTVVPAPNVLP